MPALKIGTIDSGYMYKGGDPNDQANWISVDSPAFEQALRPEPAIGFGEPGSFAPIAEGGYMGFAGEVGGGIKAATDWLAAKAQGKDIPYSELYDVNKAVLEGQIQRYAEENPATSTALEMAAAIPTSLLMPGAKASSLPQLMKAGAGMGAVYSAGKADVLEEVPAEATKGALLGAAMPVGIQAGLSGARLLGRGTAAAAKGISRPFSQSDDISARPALKAIQKAFERDGLDIGQATAKLKELGPDAVLADVGGKNVKKLANEVAALPGKSAEIAENTLQTRMSGSVSRLSGALKKALGAKTTAYKAGKDIIAQRNAQAGPLYTEAFGQTVNPQKIDAVVRNLDDYINAASGTDIGRALNKVRGSLVKTVLGEKMPKIGVRELHLAKMDLDGKIGTAVRQGNKPMAAELMKVKTDLLGVMDDVQQYKQARQIFSDDSAVLSSIERGKQILKVDAEEMSDMVQGMSKADWDGYILGATKAITDKLKGAGQTSNAANRISTHIVRERLRNAFPNEEAFGQFMKQVDIENTFAELRNITIRGSQTAERIGTGKELAIDAATDMMQGRFLGNVLNGVTDWMSGFKQIPENTRDVIGEMLFTNLAKNGRVPKHVIDKAVKAGIQRKQLDAFIMDLNNALTRGAIVAEAE